MKLQLNPYIMLDGNAQEAIDFYEEALHAKVLFKQTIGEGPMNPEQPLTVREQQLIAHAILQIGESQIFVADLIPGLQLQSGNQVTICITADSKETSQQLYDALRVEGTVNIPLEPAYFSPAYGMVTDKYGVIFQIFTSRSAN
ncbi:VOC family protein [Paenibacillus sp. sgz500958]|uniref:VOC family protein n=1 Tax=Paenibacillus sp. sgz500958 TaxID=3242475 RepID=UPI0036D3AADA